MVRFDVSGHLYPLTLKAIMEKLIFILRVFSRVEHRIDMFGMIRI